MRAFHSTWTRPYSARFSQKAYQTEPFELLTTALCALLWRRENGSIAMICDEVAARYYTSLGFDFLWDDGVHALLTDIPNDINPLAFWAGGKLYALSAMPAPCVMLDTDFLVWSSLKSRLDDCAAAAIHEEDLSPDIYPPASALHKADGFDLTQLDWTVKPLNTALLYLRDDAFRRFYTDTAISFMRSAPEADNALTYMVFAEQRLLSMCARQQNVEVRALQRLPELFGGQALFSHVWGAKQQMRQSPALYADFCMRCAARLKRDFPDAAAILQGVPVLMPYF